jgi:hypothetical protein
MTTEKIVTARKEALRRRIELSAQLPETRDQQQAWHALVTAMGAIVRLNTVSNPTTAAFFRPILVKAVNQERAYTATMSNLEAEIMSLSAKLRSGDKLLTVAQLFDEQAESEGI